MLCLNFRNFRVVMEHHKDCLDADSSEVEYTDDLYDDEEHHSSSDAEDDVDGNAADDVHDESVQQEGSINNALVGERLVNVNSIASDEILKLEFGTVDEAYEFYYRYGRCKGFAIRKGDVRSNSSGIITMREFVCNKQGLRDKKHLSRNDRKRDHRRMTRTNCEARLRVRYKAKKGRYVVSKFEEGHNHELTPPKFTHLHPLYRKISEADSAQLDALQSHGIRTCHIMGYMVAQKGGYADVGFTKKDLYNYFDKKMRDVIKDGDVAAALKHLNVKSSTDPMLYAEYDVNIDGRMKSLFWADGSSRSDYFCFGDVLAFDATYKKNKYNYPLCIFSGCNHHSQTIIFGVALLEDETIESYKWVLNRFLECMENKFPKAVVTDGDGSMREAIKQVFPDASHRLCAWHLHKNAQENVKKTPFLEGFGKAMYSNFTPEQFEEFWSELIQNNELEENDWVKKTYANKSLWATAYLRDKFFGRIRTTSQCEAINAIVKTYVRAKGNIFEFMHNFEQVLRDYRNSELAAEFKSKFTEPVLTTHLRSIESDAAKIYTAEIFKEVKDEIIEAGAVSLKSKECVGDTMVYTLRKYREKGIEREVVYDAASLEFQCSCRLFETRGIPCCHVFFVMKEEDIDHIPKCLVMTRWTKNAKDAFLNNDSNGEMDSDMIEVARFGAYCSAFTAFCKEASKKNGVFRDIMDEILNLQQKYCDTEYSTRSEKLTDDQVGDPIPVKSKGAPKKKKNATKSVRHCSKCRSTSHTARHCSVICLYMI
jgi:hypothetical protein